VGLDLVVQSCAKDGHEAEWRGFIESLFDADEASEAEIARFQEISIPPYARLGAPRVGYDAAADAWILEVRKAKTEDERAAVLKDFHGYYALGLVTSDGLPKYTHANLYDGVDETSFRGSFLSMCTDVLSADLIEDAWNHKMPDAAVAYGRALLAAADAAKPPPPPPAPSAEKKGFLARLFSAKLVHRPPAEPFDEQVKIVRAAGRWYVFWGERGHPIQAWS
jgi:hypothetical protein